MSPIEIRSFDASKLEELAKDQTAIYNAGIAKFPETVPVQAEDIIERFKKDTFDQGRMFYAFDGDRMVGYAGLTGRNQEQNQRGIGYPWLAEGTDPSVRDLLYDAMLEKCKEEGTKRLQFFRGERFAELIDYFKSKGFDVDHEFLAYEKKLAKNDFSLPSGYTIRILQREDLQTIEEVSKKDPKLKEPFNATNYGQFMDSNNYKPENSIVVEKEGNIVGFYATFVPPNPEVARAFFGGGTVHGDYQEIEPFLVQEIENRALEQGKEKMDITFYPDSPRLELAQKLGYKQYSHRYRLIKEL